MVVSSLVMDKNMEKRNWHNTFMEIAKLIALHSTCAKIQVGALMVKDNRIISMGYNGVAAGIKPHCNEIFKNSAFTNEQKIIEHRAFQIENEIHAEANCIAYAAKNGISTAGTSMYVTLSPCADCAKMIVAAGIYEVFYNEKYSDESGLLILKKNGIYTFKHKGE